MKKISVLLFLVLMGGIFSGCTTASASNSHEITGKDAGKMIELKIGDTLVVALDGNLTTGFNWIPAPQDPELLEQTGEVEVTPASNDLGAPGKIVLKFKAVVKGQTILHLDYKRSWEKSITPDKTFEVSVVVK